MSKSIGILYKVKLNAYSTHIDPIIKRQKRAVRTITFAHCLDHTGPILRN